MSRRFLAALAALTCGAFLCCFLVSLQATPLAVPAGTNAAHDKVQQALVPEIVKRLRFLEQVGLGYIALGRPAQTLSGGEAQRARLAGHLGAGLLGVCYILDEQTVGLHARDTGKLLTALRALQQRGSVRGRSRPIPAG